MNNKNNNIINTFAYFCDKKIISSFAFNELIHKTFPDNIDHNIIKHLLMLKEIPRTGWKMLKITEPENILDHTISVFKISQSILNHKKYSDLNSNKTLQMCLIHDIGESVCGDIVALTLLEKEKKFKTEQQAIKAIFKTSTSLHDLWMEFETEQSKEAIFVKELDKLQMIYKAFSYQTLYPHINLKEFKHSDPSRFAITKNIYKKIIKCWS